MRFQGKSVLVTGATRGIGMAAARAFLREGARVAINGRTESSVAASMASFDGDVTPAPGDVATAHGCSQAVGATLEAFGGLDVLVNNAGVFLRADVDETSEEAWDHLMAANVKSVLFCTKAALAALKASRGTIVNIASESGLNGYPGTTAYCASKGAVVSLTRAMAMEFAPDIRVNALCPGVIETDMTRAGFAIDGDENEGIRRQQDAYPLKRTGTLDEASAAILFLASGEAGFINGAALPMDGGATVGKW